MTRIFLKSYCYNQHELAFVIANLREGYKYIDKLILYEYNYTHTGVEKDYRLEKVLHHIPGELREKLDYKKIDLKNYNIYAYKNEPGNPKIHRHNEPIQRSWLFNDKDYQLEDDDIIIDHDIDEIIYENSYPILIEELKRKKRPLSIKLNQFFFKNNYLWKDIMFSSPTIYNYRMVKKINKKIKGLKIQNLRDLPHKTDRIYGCHMSWVMPVDYMITKLHSYSHPEYRSFADKEKLQRAIDEKKYIFDLKRPFNIEELLFDDERIPKSLQKNNIFEYLQ